MVGAHFVKNNRRLQIENIHGIQVAGRQQTVVTITYLASKSLEIPTDIGA